MRLSINTREAGYQPGLAFRIIFLRMPNNRVTVTLPEVGDGVGRDLHFRIVSKPIMGSMGGGGGSGPVSICLACGQVESNKP